VAQPCSDEEYDIILKQFDYDRMPLNPIIESIDESSPFWRRREKITFNAAYDGERVIAYLFIPKDVEPPYQIVVYWPGASAPNTKSFQSLPERDFTEFVITSGRALLFPIYKGTFERQFPKNPHIVETPLTFRDWVVKLGKDLCRSVDYLETREDIDFDHLAYYGMDSGAGFGPMALAIDQRFKAAVLVAGGFVDWEILEKLRSIDPLNHAPRVRIPVLMINGSEDCFFPLERGVRPMYERLGTPESHKELRIYPGGHGLLSLFSKQIRGDVLGWLDRYLEPVNGTKSDMK
jgi:cephalosporin-C deacetylase-like acetyl esterase